jgi:hypothetical protein
MNQHSPWNPLPQWTPEPPRPLPPRKPWSYLAEILVWVGLIGIVASVVIPLYVGRPIPDQQYSGALGGFALFPYLIARLRRLSAPWAYPLAGAAICLSLLALGPALRKAPAGEAEVNDMIAALERFEPEAAKQARAFESDPAKMQAILQPVLTRAVMVARDEDVVAYGESLMQLVDGPRGVNRPRCEQIAMEGRSRHDSIEDLLQISRTTTQLIRAATGRTVPAEIDRTRAAQISEEVMAAADPQGLTSSPALAETVTPAEACELYLRVIREVRTLSPADNALYLRARMVQPG